MRKIYWVIALAAGALLFIAAAIVKIFTAREEKEQEHYQRQESKLLVSPLADARVTLYKAGKNLSDTTRIVSFSEEPLWLPPGNYFLRSETNGTTLFWPAPLVGYRAGPDEDGSFAVTTRSAPNVTPPRLLPTLPDFVYIPSGSFLFGDRFNPREPHYVWLTGYFINPFEVTNAEFREFIADPQGYADDKYWTESGRQWKAANVSQVTALLKPEDERYSRFGQLDQPVVWLNWFEAQAYCQWLTHKIGDRHWQFALPTEAEWEKAARGPDNFEYALSNSLSDAEVRWYNWKKNPDAEITVVGLAASKQAYQPNRYGLFHMSGNVVEWTQSLHLPFNKIHPYLEYDRERNDPAKPGLRVARGGSWYSASVALLQIHYREAFQPEHSTQDIGFRLVARLLP